MLSSKMNSLHQKKLKFAANLTTMFKEHANLLDRFQAAKDCGFKACECQFPYDCDVESLQRSRDNSGLIHTLINSYPGDMTKNFLGFACLPSYEKEFKDSLYRSLRYAEALNCSKIHVMAGIVSNEYEHAVLEDTYIRNLKIAAEIFEEHGVYGVIEPLCPEVKKGYFLASYEKALAYVEAVHSRHIRVLLDVYHLQMLHGDILTRIQCLYPYIGHIQISQAPGREEPSYPGLIDYNSVFALLCDLGHTDFIGLEYVPSVTTRESLNWWKDFAM